MKVILKEIKRWKWEKLKDVDKKKCRFNLGFPDFPEETIKQRLIDPKGPLSLRELSE